MNALIRSALVLAAVASPALAQTSIDPNNKFCWAENAGFLNWADASSPAVISATFLSGYVWAENVGWISLGDGSPANGTSYANTSGADSGVNLNTTTDELSGFAWSENAGWINFAGGALASPPNPARIDWVGARLRGFAWSENLGWINLDDASKYVGLLCPADFNRDSQVDFFDYLDFAAAFDIGDSSADFNRDAQVDFFDYLDFAAAFDAGC
jgi:hypothetical protein